MNELRRMRERNVEAVNDPAQAAGLELGPYGGPFLRGTTGTFRPYLPGGAYL